MKQTKTETILDIADYLEGSSLDTAIKKLIEWKNEYAGRYSNLRLIIKYGSDNRQFELVGERLETDAEEKAREKASQESERMTRLIELEALARLKKKYEQQ